MSPYEYNGHYAWVHVLNNDLNVEGHSLFDWLAKQHNTVKKG